MRHVNVFDRKDADFMVLAQLIEYCRLEAKQLRLELLEYLLGIAQAELVECLGRTGAPGKLDS